MVKVNQAVSVEALQAESRALKAQVAELKAQLEAAKSCTDRPQTSERLPSGSIAAAPNARVPFLPKWLLRMHAPDVVLCLVMLQTVLLLAMQR